MVMREFIVKNYRKLLQIIDSQFENQSTSSDPDTFCQLLQTEYKVDRKISDEILMYLRAGRSVHLMVDENNNLSHEEIDISTKIRHHKGQDKKLEYEILADKLIDQKMMEDEVIAKDQFVTRGR